MNLKLSFTDPLLRSVILEETENKNKGMNGRSFLVKLNRNQMKSRSVFMSNQSNHPTSL